MGQSRFAATERLERGAQLPGSWLLDVPPSRRSSEAQQAFVELLGLLLRLRKEGHVKFPDGRVSKTTAGTYLAVAPVELTDTGRAALLQDRRLGERPGRTSDRLWRLD